MSNSLILFRSTNFDGNNKLIYNIPQGISLKNKEVALHSFSFYNSFFNISKEIGNNQVDFFFPVFTASANTYNMKKYTWTIADGFYSFSDLGFALQQFFIANKLCLYNEATGRYMYFFSILQNITQYSVQLQTYYIPTRAQAQALGFGNIPNPNNSNPAPDMQLNTATGATSLQIAPYISFNEAFGKVIGYNATTFPSTLLTKAATTYDQNPITALSSKTPSVNPIDCVLLRCNIANNINSIPNDLLSVTPISSSYGAITQYVANSLLYVPTAQITTNRIEVSMYDQNLVPLLQRDREITLTLSIRDSATPSKD